MENITVDQSNSLEIILLLVGNQGVGKTTTILKLLETRREAEGPPSAPVGGEALTEQSSSHFVQTWQHTILVNGKWINIILWDPVGCKSGSDIDVNYFALADAVILMFDCTDKSTFSAMSSWHRYVRNSAEKDTLIFVFGTNYDSRKSTVNPREVRRVSRTLGAMRTFLLMTRTQSIVEDIFRTIIQHVLYQRKLKQVATREPGGISFLRSTNRWVNLTGAIVQGVRDWMHPHYITYNPLTPQEDMTSSDRIEGDYLDPQTEGQSLEKGFACFSITPPETEENEIEESAQFFHPGPSTSGATSQSPGTK